MADAPANADQRWDSTPRLVVYRWDEKQGRWQLPVPVDAPRKVLTARGLLTAVETLVRDHPDLADLPVHVLDMRPENEPEVVYSNLLTDVETDVFDDEQGMVLSLMSWPHKPSKNGRGEP